MPIKTRSNVSAEKNSQYSKFYHLRVRYGVLAHYTNGCIRCMCCGETNIGFLTIDHTNGGDKHRKEIGIGGGSQMYKWLKDHQYPSGFQVLCYNCNCGRQTNGGSCPHSTPLPSQEEVKLRNVIYDDDIANSGKSHTVKAKMRRRLRGVCIQCGTKKDRDGARCQKCCIKHRAKWQRWYQRKKLATANALRQAK